MFFTLNRPTLQLNMHESLIGGDRSILASIEGVNQTLKQGLRAGHNGQIDSIKIGPALVTRPLRERDLVVDIVFA